MPTLGVASETPSCPPHPPQVSLYNRYEALDVDGQSMDEKDEGPFTPEVVTR